MYNCSFYGLVAEAFSNTLEEITLGRSGDYFILKLMCVDFEEQLKEGEIEDPCLECDNCLTFVENRRIVYGYLFDGKDQKWVIEQVQQIRKIRGLAQILRHHEFIQIDPEDFNRTPYLPNNNTLVYLDHNVMDKFHKEEEKKKRLVPGYADIQYVYSPSHLEEINRMNNKDEEQKVLSTIREVTGSLIISNFDGNQLSLAYEDPNYGMQRVLKNDVAPDVEAYRVIINDDRKIFHPERTDETYLRELNYDQVFNHPTVVGVYEDFESREILDESGHVKRFSFVHQAIHALVRALDNLGYKYDKGRAIKSSAHDIEHMIYAAGTDIFVTMDKKFKERASLIYRRLDISTKVMNWEEYMRFVDSKAH